MTLTTNGPSQPALTREQREQAKREADITQRQRGGKKGKKGGDQKKK